MSDQTISIYCEACPDATASEPCVSVPAQQLDASVVSVKTVARTAYTYCARAARRLRWFVTVRARAFSVAIESRVRAFLNNVFPKTGADILRQSAILNI